MAEGALIKAIDASSVHQIQSGQVIVDLSSVAKELVENSLDAGATAIEVRFKNQGLDSIDVQDNGSGVAPQNYESLALKHYTSKLSSYADLDTLDTFGFRGEALSSLCALSHFTVTTCLASEAPRGTRLDFETSGKLKGTGVVAAQKGTTVSIETLFYNLPVRRRELERNIKREWGKVINLLNQYACVQTGIKFTVTQQPTKGKRTTLFSTKGNPTTRENIVNVFGAKTMSALITMDLELDLDVTTGRSSLSSGGAKNAQSTKVRVVGHVSRPARGEGRQTPDRQMFYVNGRPCALPQFAKVFNEVYRAYNSTQSPFIFADIRLDTHLYDVNVSPDKRTILLHDQGRMLDNLRESLIELFEKQDIVIPASQLLSAQKQTPFKTPTSVRSVTPASYHPRQTSGPPQAVAGTDDTPSASRRDSARSPLPDEEFEVEDPEPETETEQAGNLAQPWRSVSSGSLVRDAGSLNLISKRAARNSLDRSEQPAIPARTSENREDGMSKNLQSLLAKLRGDSGDSTSDATRPDPEQVTAENTLPEQREQPQDDTERLPAEPPIPAIVPPRIQSPRAGPPFSVSRPFKRSSPEPATITIGDHTVTGLIGSTSSSVKRQKVAHGGGGSQSSHAAGKGKAKAPLPSFGGRLSQMFAAASERAPIGSGTLQTAAEDVDDEEELSGGEDEEGGRSGSEIGDNQSAHSEGDRDRDQDQGSEEEEAGLAPTSVTMAEPPPQPEEDGDEDMRSEADEAGEHSHCAHAHDEDGEYVDEDERKKRDEENVQRMIAEAEKAAASTQLSEDGKKRSQAFLNGRSSRRKDATFDLMQRVKLDETSITRRVEHWHDSLERAHSAAASFQTGGNGNSDAANDNGSSGDGLEAETANAEERLSLTITKSDFHRMKIVGQFNLGFILAVREAADAATSEGNIKTTQKDDELFIIDQHASDEKYNFERLQAATILQSQRLVHPKLLELTALEEEIVMENMPALEANGFQVEVDTSGVSPVGSRVRLLSLPLSRETTFELSDLEELISLLADNPTTTTTMMEGEEGEGGEVVVEGEKKAATTTLRYIPRPARVRKMFAMRACRSSIMIGRALSVAQMEKVVRHMGGMEKPWNCPHGRPTMRHLCGLGAVWDRAAAAAAADGADGGRGRGMGMGWTEGMIDFDDFDGEGGIGGVDWGVYQQEVGDEEEEEGEGDGDEGDEDDGDGNGEDGEGNDEDSGD